MGYLALLDLNINYKAVAAAAFVRWVIGGLWYAKFLFGPAWMRLIGKTEEELKKSGFPAKAVGLALVWSGVTAYVLALVIFAAGADQLSRGVNDREALMIGIKCERGSHKFFKRYGEKFEDSEGKKIFLEFADEERAHLELLIREYRGLLDRQRRRGRARDTRRPRGTRASAYLWQELADLKKS